MTELTESSDHENEENEKQRYLTFRLGEGLFGINIRYIDEILGMQPITAVPEMPDYIKGVVKLRETIIPIMDVRLRFKIPEKDYTDRTCIIVTDFGGTAVGLIVDSVSEVLAIPAEDISDSCGFNSEGARGYVEGIGKIKDGIILLIDCAKLLNREELSALSAQL